MPPRGKTLGGKPKYLKGIKISLFLIKQRTRYKMTIYSQEADIKALIGFTLDTNSLPTLLDVSKIQGHAYRMINGYIGGEQTPDDNLKTIETDLVVAQILAIHSKRPFPMRFTMEHKVILDDYQDPEDFNSLNEFYYEYD